MAYMDRNDIVVLADEIRTLSDQTYMLREEGEELQEEVEALVDKKAPAIINYASGAIASFADGADDVPLKGLKFNIKPKQDLHGYSYPWPDAGNINKLPSPTATSKTVNGITIAVNNGVYSISGTATAQAEIIFDLPSTVTYNTSWKTCFLNDAINAGVVFYYRLDNTSGTSMGFSNSTNRVLEHTYEQSANKVRFLVSNGTAISGTLHVSPMLMLKTEANPTSFSPYSNISPISGWSQVDAVAAGKNLLKMSDCIDGYYIVVNSTYPNGRIASISGASVFYASVPKNTTLTYSADAGDRCVIVGYKERPSVLSGAVADSVFINTGAQLLSATFNTGENTFVALYLNRYAATKPTKVMLELGSTASPYTAPTLTPITIQLGQTVYGATEDALAGKLVTTGVAVDMGTLSWEAGTDSVGQYFKANLSTLAKRRSGNLLEGAICAMYPQMPTNNVTDKSFAISVTGSPIYVRDTSYNTAAAFKTAMSGIKVFYPIDSPTETDLTPVSVSSLLGQNIVWASCGETEVEYVADTKLYIEKLTQPTEDDMVANANIESGKYFMVGNTLYLSTATISAGETIKPGTNCTLTNLAAALNAINA